MKNVVLLILLAFAAINSNAQFSEISNAIKNQNVNELSKYFDAQVELITPNQDGNFSKAEAIVIMKSFFSTYKTTSFTLRHQGASKGQSSEYAIGDMTASGVNFRVFIFLYEKDGQVFIQQLQFEKE